MRQENEEWLFGRCRRGCEGLFPANYVEVKVPLGRTNRQQLSKQGPTAAAIVAKPNVPSIVVAPKEQPQQSCRALYDFNAETVEDLTIRVSEREGGGILREKITNYTICFFLNILQEGEIITVIEEINAEWLLGRKRNGTQGQFPAAFVEYL